MTDAVTASVLSACPARAVLSTSQGVRLRRAQRQFGMIPCPGVRVLLWNGTEPVSKPVVICLSVANESKCTSEQLRKGLYGFGSRLRAHSTRGELLNRASGRFTRRTESREMPQFDEDESSGLSGQPIASDYSLET